MAEIVGCLEGELGAIEVVICEVVCAKVIQILGKAR